MKNLFSQPIVSTMNSEIEQFETYKSEFEDDIKSMDTKTALKYIKSQIKSIKNVPLKDELYYSGINFMKEKEQEIKNQITLEKKIENLIGKLKPIKYLKNEFLKIKKEYNQQIKKSKKELKNLKQDSSENLKQLQTEKQKRAITIESVFLTKEQIKQLKNEKQRIIETN